MKCYNCGRELESDSAFCIFCGKAQPVGKPISSFSAAGNIPPRNTGGSSKLKISGSFSGHSSNEGMPYQSAPMSADAPQNGYVPMPNGAPECARSSKKIPVLIVSISAAAMVAVFLCLFFLTDIFRPSSEKRVRSGSREQSSSASVSETTSQSPKTTVSVETFYGQWTTYELVYEHFLMYTVSINSDYTIEVVVSDADYGGVYDTYSGTWILDSTTDRNVVITANFPTEGATQTISIRKDGSSIYFSSSDTGKMYILWEREYRKNYDFMAWKEKYYYPKPTPTEEKQTDYNIYYIYKDYFYSNFNSNDRVCLADVTYDGYDEMIVVHFADEMKYEIEGYVFTTDSAGNVQQINYKIGSSFHQYAGGYFTWYLKPNGGSFNLQEEYGEWTLGLGEMTFHEYNLTNDGDVNNLSSISISSLDYSSMEESMDAYDRYAEDVRMRKRYSYVIYCEPGGGDDPEVSYKMETNTAIVFAN